MRDLIARKRVIHLHACLPFIAPELRNLVRDAVLIRIAVVIRDRLYKFVEIKRPATQLRRSEAPRVPRIGIDEGHLESVIRPGILSRMVFENSPGRARSPPPHLLFFHYGSGETQIDVARRHLPRERVAISDIRLSPVRFPPGVPVDGVTEPQIRVGNPPALLQHSLVYIAQIQRIFPEPEFLNRLLVRRGFALLPRLLVPHQEHRLHEAALPVGQSRQAVHVGPVGRFGVALGLMAQSHEEIGIRTTGMSFDIVSKQGNQRIRHPRHIVRQPQMHPGRPVIRIQPQSAAQIVDPDVHVHVRVTSLRKRAPRGHVSIPGHAHRIPRFLAREKRHLPRPDHVPPRPIVRSHVFRVQRNGLAGLFVGRGPRSGSPKQFRERCNIVRVLGFAFPRPRQQRPRLLARIRRAFFQLQSRERVHGLSRPVVFHRLLREIPARFPLQRRIRGCQNERIHLRRVGLRGQRRGR